MQNITPTMSHVANAYDLAPCDAILAAYEEAVHEGTIWTVCAAALLACGPAWPKTFTVSIKQNDSSHCHAPRGTSQL